MAYTFWMGVVLGSLALLMVQHLSGGVWGMILRRPFEAAVRTLPYMAVLFLPIAFGMHSIYEWSHPESAERSDHCAEGALPERAVLPGPPGLLLPGVGDDRHAALTSGRTSTIAPAIPALLDKMSRLSGAGLLIYFLTVTFAMVDWTMSVNPHWFSTIWGMLYIGGQGLSAFAFGICVLVMLAQTAPLNRVLTTASLPRPRQVPVRVPDAVGVPVVLAVPDHLVGEPPRRDPALPESLGQQLAATSASSSSSGTSSCPYALLLSRDLKRNMGKLRIIATWILCRAVRRLLLARRP